MYKKLRDLILSKDGPIGKPRGLPITKALGEFYIDIQTMNDALNLAREEVEMRTRIAKARRVQKRDPERLHSRTRKLPEPDA